MMIKTMAKSAPVGTVNNLPVWECRECDGWQSAINAAGGAVAPTPCECGNARRFKETIGWCNSHKIIVVALAAKGWRFPAGTEEWAARA